MKLRWSIAAIFALAGCGHAEAHFAPFAPARPPTSHVEIHTTTLPAAPFAEQGLVQVLAWGNATDERTMIAALEQEAKRRGCDAVVRVRLDEGAGEAQAIGVCVVFAR